MLILSSCLLSSLLSIFSCLVSSLPFHLLLSSCLVPSSLSSSLVFLSLLSHVSSHVLLLLLSFLVSPLSIFSFLPFHLLVLSRLSFYVSLSLSVSLCLSVSVCLSLCLSVCVEWCVWCPHVYVQKRLRVYVQNASVCRFKTEVFETDTRVRGEGKEGERRRVKVSSANHEKAHVELSRALEVHRKKPLVLTHSRFENRSRTTRSRVLQSFALPD